MPEIAARVVRVDMRMDNNRESNLERRALLAGRRGLLAGRRALLAGLRRQVCGQASSQFMFLANVRASSEMVPSSWLRWMYCWIINMKFIGLYASSS